MSQFADKLNALIQAAVADISCRKEEEHEVHCIASETLGEIIEKLIILHIRIWNLEDAAGVAMRSEDKETFIAINEKLDECDRVIRPRLMAALGLMLEEAVIRGRVDLLRNRNVKYYGGIL